jgi:ATP-dependent RNA helicase DDX23/PRP28
MPLISFYTIMLLTNTLFFFLRFVPSLGSGKTLAFAIPLCHYILHLPSHILRNVAESGPLALIMAPTRELALQIDIEIKKLLSTQQQQQRKQLNYNNDNNKSNNNNNNIIIKTCPIVGGQNMQRQAQELRSGIHILVGTPGRINECIDMAYLVLNQCCYIVLDEVRLNIP